MSPSTAVLHPLMEQAVDACIAHVQAGGLPFVGVLVDRSGTVLTEPGVNQVFQSGDPSAHAEIVAMREAITTGTATSLRGAVLLATGEPCGLCYRYAIDHGIEKIYVAVDRDQVAALGFDYRSSYAAFGITDADRAELFHPLPVPRGTHPFTHYLHPTGRAPARPSTSAKGTPS